MSYVNSFQDMYVYFSKNFVFLNRFSCHKTQLDSLTHKTGDVDDGAILDAVRPHGGRERLVDVESSLQVDRDDVIELGLGHLEQIAVLRDPRTVHHDVWMLAVLGEDLQ